MSGALLLDILRAIKKSKNRFISLIIIVALGAGFFVGVKSAAPSMEATAVEYFKENNLMDIRIQSTVGLTEDDLNELKTVPGVKGAMGEKFADALVLVNGQPEIDIDGSQISTRAYGIDLNMLQEYYYGGKNDNFINRPTLLEGSYPTKSNQCLVDASRLSTPDSYKIGNKITLEADSNTDLSGLSVTEFEIVGIIESPYYISFERGNSLVGSGKIGTYIYIPNSAFSNDYYSEIYLTVDGASAIQPFTDEYFNFIEPTVKAVKEIGEKNVSARVDTLKTTLPERIVTAEKDYKSAKTKLDSGLKAAQEQIAQFQKYVDDPDGSYNEAVAKVAGALGLAESEFNGNSSDYQKAIETYNKYLEEYKAAKTTQAEKLKQLNSAQAQFNTAQTALTTAKNTVATATQLVSSTQSVIDSANSILTSLEAYQKGQMDNSQLAQALETLRALNPDLYRAISSLSAVSMATEAIALVNPYLEEQKKQLAVYEANLKAKNEELAEYQKKFDAADVVLTAAKAAYNQSETQINTAYEMLNGYYNQLEGSKGELSMAQIELMLKQNSANNDLALLKATIANAQSYLDKAKSEYSAAKADAETKLAAAENQIESIKQLYKKLDSAKWNVYDRNSTPGYNSYESAVNNVRVLSNIFPIIFFLVAALVCLTTMSRMVEEERTLMGTKKALGYSNTAIASKYVLYALFASIFGSAIGILICIYALPFAIFKAYSIMFTLPNLKYDFPALYIILGVAITILTTIIASVAACAKELKVKPASLMRPKAPKPGKRVLLEKIPFIWKRINFTGKVTIRNLFRRKARCIMTVIGIGSCTALILASCGLYSSINNLMKKQYSDNGIAQYDLQIVFAENQTPDSAAMDILTSDSRITDIMLSSMTSVTGGSDKVDKTEDVYLLVPNDSQKLADYVKLQNRQNGEALTFDDTGAIITEKFAQDTNTKIGDSVWIETSDGERYNIPVAAITENYTFNYIYLSENLYQYIFQQKVQYNYALCNVDSSILEDVSNNGEVTMKSQFAEELMKRSEINAVAFVSDTIETLNEVIGVLSVIIAIFIIAAGLLAFIVLYNLSNINISERQRELATIKVLGFHNKEVSEYIYRENIVLTVVGILFGLVMGIFVHKLLITYCSVDTVMFVQNIAWYNYLIATFLTVLFAVIINLIMHKKMRTIDMVESLKAIE